MVFLCPWCEHAPVMHSDPRLPTLRCACGAVGNAVSVEKTWEGRLRGRDMSDRMATFVFVIIGLTLIGAFLVWVDARNTIARAECACGSYSVDAWFSSGALTYVVCGKRDVRLLPNRNTACEPQQPTVSCP